MARNKNPDAVVINSPRGKLKFPKLTEVDYGTDKYPDKDGSYNTRVVYDTANPTVQKFTAKLDQLMERARELAEEKYAELPVKARKELEKKKGGVGLSPDLPYSEVYDDETEEPTGEIEMRFKKKAGGTRKKDGKKWVASRPDVFDAKKNPLPKGVEIWGGSVALINAEYVPYFVAGTGSYGLQRQLNAVQVFELVSAGGQRNANSYGFEEDEDGFDSSGMEVSEKEDDADTSTDSDDDDGEGADF